MSEPRWKQFPNRKWRCGNCGEYTFHRCEHGDECFYQSDPSWARMGPYPYRCHNPNCQSQRETGDLCAGNTHHSEPWFNEARDRDYIEDAPVKRVVEELAWDETKGWVSSA